VPGFGRDLVANRARLANIAAAVTAVDGGTIAFQ
jgi:hypothetical protein